jgi:co-chaperonin GroES (HSP10)
MATIMPMGARVLVEDIAPVVDVVERAKKVGLVAVVLDENVPPPTSGKVVAVGTDPLAQELVKVGDVVLFGRNSGVGVQVQGRSYRSLELRELISVIREDEPSPASGQTQSGPEPLLELPLLPEQEPQQPKPPGLE